MKSNEELREAYIDSIKLERSSGWIFLVVSSLTMLALWIFGAPEIWPIKKKIIATAITLVVFVWLFGIARIQFANKKLKEEMK